MTNCVKGRIRSVARDSAAYEGGIRAGDRLLSVNGRKVRDIFDYRFLTADENVSLELVDAGGEPYIVDIEKDPYEDLGIEFEQELIDSDRGCANQCVFCFIDQMPEGMRETLYFKDDDTRLSFLTGNYVTLTNIGSREIERIIQYRMSPVNVSVHTTNPQLRCRMLGNPKAGRVMEQLKRLTEGCITVNAQIVLCPGMNDGAELDRTLSDLSALHMGIASVSVVPVGLTKYREGLAPLRLFTSAECGEIINYIEGKQDEFYQKLGRYFVYAADELYVKAGRALPSYDRYDDFPQLENGVGMAALLDHEVCDYMMRRRRQLKKEFGGAEKIRVSIATGHAAYDIINGLAQYVAAAYPHLCVHVYAIDNIFFGETITVSGLLTGQDLTAQLSGKDLGDVLLITKNMLRSGGDVFLDDMTVSQVARRLGVPICAVDDSGESFVRNLLGGGQEGSRYE